MTNVVLKAINTETRRLRIGDAVGESDDLTPHNFSDLKSRGFIGSKDAPVSVPSRFSKAAAMKGDGE